MSAFIYRDAWSAEISADGLYRYNLRRAWSRAEWVVWLMLNPSTADAQVDDPTIRRCRSFSQSWGYGGLVVVNLFALRATHPRRLVECIDSGGDAVGPENDHWTREALLSGAPVVCAFGAHPFALERARAVLAMAGDARLECLGVNRDGTPRHPLYVPGTAKRERFVVNGAPEQRLGHFGRVEHDPQP